ncbi:MAG TPA: ABC transporter permease [Thermoplasmata archaeon]|nr:ABC transporter permease [Thermoplasmata archaeon]
MATGAPRPPNRARGYSAAVGFYRIMRSNPLSFAGFVLVVAILVLAAASTLDPRLVAPYGASQQTGVYSEPPTILRGSPSLQHPFGTDGGSLDIYSEVMLGLPLDVGIGVLIAGLAMILGGLLGLVAGFWDRPGTVGGYASTVILRTTDVFLAFPSLILGLAIVAALGPGVWQVILAVTATWWPYYVRLVRGEVLAIRHLPYVVAARAAGVSEGRILVRHILRNVLEPLIVYFTLDIGTVLVTFSTISYVIPQGIPYPPTFGRPEWGSMMSYYYGNTLFSQAWWSIIFPAVAIFVTALSFSLLGEGLRDVLDPRMRRALTESTVGHTPPAETPSSPVPGPLSEAG